MKLIGGRSYFISSSQPLESWLEMFPLIDRLIVDGSVMNVKEARDLIRHSLEQPFGEQRLLLINQADQLSETIQNTFLKLLEEPPTFLVVLLVGTSFDQLIPTVRSRLHRLSLATATNEEPIGEEVVSAANWRKKLESFKERTELASYLTSLISFYQHQLLNQPSDQRINQVRELDRAVRRLKQNANQKLVIDALVLNWPFN